MCSSMAMFSGRSKLSSESKTRFFYSLLTQNLLKSHARYVCTAHQVPILKKANERRFFFYQFGHMRLRVPFWGFFSRVRFSERCKKKRQTWFSTIFFSRDLSLQVNYENKIPRQTLRFSFASMPDGVISSRSYYIFPLRIMVDLIVFHVSVDVK